MPAITWDEVGARKFETGVDHGVLYLPNNEGEYSDGVAWNGLTTVTESPEGAEANAQYADNIKYLNLVSAEEFGGTIEAFTYPDEFAACDGTLEVAPGVTIGQQNRRLFGFAYRTLIGDAAQGTELGYKIHLVYGALAAPSEKANATVNDSPEAAAFSWEITTSPVAVTGHKPTSLVTLDSTKIDGSTMEAIEEILYGSGSVEARLPLPDEIIDLLDGGSITEVRLTNANAPTYNSSTHVVTLPAVAGVQWKVDGVNKPNGAQSPLTTGQTVSITAHPQAGYKIAGDDDFAFSY